MTNKTIEQNRAMFFDMQEHPEKYTDGQIKELLADKDIKEFLHYMAMTKRAIVKRNSKKVDIDEEWRKFNKQNFVHQRIKIVAIAIGMIFLSGVALVAAIQLGVFYTPKEKQLIVEQNRKENITRKGCKKSISIIQKDTLSEKPIIFEDVELGNILVQMATYYKAKLIFRNETSSHIHLYFNWDKKKTLERNIELLNGFDRINITYSGNIIMVE